MGFFDKLLGKKTEKSEYKQMKSTEELQTYITEENKRIENNVPTDVKKLHSSGKTLVMECPACGKKTAMGKVDRHGIVELRCESCGWSGSIGFG